MRVAAFVLSLFAYSIGIYNIGFTSGRQRTMREFDEFLEHMEHALRDLEGGD